MTIAVIYITLGVLYTIACVLDGQDVKPLWKRWLGSKLENYADKLKPINYCKMYHCMYYQRAMQAEREAKVQERLAAMGADNTTLRISSERGTPLTVAKNVCVSEFDVMDAHRRYGTSAKSVLVYQAKQHIVRCIAAAIEKHNMVHFDIREDDFRRDTYVNGELTVIIK